MIALNKQALREKFEAWAEEAGALPWGYLKKQHTASGNYSVQIYTYMWHAWSSCHEALLDENIQLQREKEAIEAVALALRDDMREAREKQESAENNLIDSECHVAELEESLRDKQALLEAAEKRNAELEARTPYGYLRQCDGQIQISIGSERPHNRSGGCATPWFAIYTAAGIGVKGE